MAETKPLLISADGLRPKYRWRLDEYGAAGALTTDQRCALCDRFGLTADQAGELSLKLGFVLDSASEAAKVTVDRQKAADKAREAMGAGLDALMNAATIMTAAIERFDQLDTSTAADPLWAERFRELHIDWDRVILDIEDLHRRLGFMADQQDVAFDLSAVNLRKVPDVRRKQVLEVIFTFWEGVGRPLGISFNSVTNERGGKLLDFAQMTTSFLLDPVSSDTANDADDWEEQLEVESAPADVPTGPLRLISKNTIVADLQRFKKARLNG